MHGHVESVPYQDERVRAAEGERDAGHEARHGGEVEEVAQPRDRLVGAQGLEALALAARRLLRQEVADAVPVGLKAKDEGK
jgi:hypothetical protein